MSHSVTLANRTVGLTDRIKFNLALIPQHWGNLIFHLIFPLAGIGLLALVLSQHKPVTTSVIAVVMMCLLFTPFLITVIALATHYGNKIAREPFTYRIDDGGIHVTSASLEFTHRWSTIQKVQPVAGYLMLFFGPGQAHCLPLEWLSADDISTIVALAGAQGVTAKGLNIK